MWGGRNKDDSDRDEEMFSKLMNRFFPIDEFFRKNPVQFDDYFSYNAPLTDIKVSTF